ncbi:MAG: DNA primase [Holosporales bacterium]|jgi:DNA primase|nr:DNA primase [Holosporales bacterium]
MNNLNTVTAMIKEKILLSRIIGQDVVLRKKGREFVGNCPFHNEKTASFFVNDDKGTFYCFGCGASGDIFEYLGKKHGLHFTQALEKMAEMAGVKLPEKRQNDYLKNQQRILQEAMKFFQLNLTKDRHVLDYCNKRGINKELIDKFSIGYSTADETLLVKHVRNMNFSADEILQSGIFLKKVNGVTSRFKNRLMFPVCNTSGIPIAFGGRILQKDGIPKYLNSAETVMFQKKETLYGYNIAVKNVTNENPFIVVEGYMDVIMMHKFGFNTTIASMGTAISIEHLAKIWRYSDEPIVCLDGDSAGHNAMIKIAMLAIQYIQPGKSLRFCLLPSGNDPDDFLRNNTATAMTQLLSDSLYLVDFIWLYFAGIFDDMKNKTPEKIAKWKMEVTACIDGIQNVDIRKLYKNEINERIFSILKQHGNKGRKIKRCVPPSFVNKTEKILLREAFLLYILMKYPSVISSVVEKLATVIFANDEFERLKSYIVEYGDSADFENCGFVKAIASVKRLSIKNSCFSKLEDVDVLELWNDVFDLSFSQKAHLNDINAAKKDCNEALSTSSWERLKALKMAILHRKNENI